MRKLIFAICISFSPYASAEFIELPKSERFSTLGLALENAAKNSDLSGDAAIAAKQVASGWYYLGPCKGRADEIPNGVIETALNANPKTPYGSAILQMIGILALESTLGRNPTPQGCEFAKAMANAK